MKLFPIALSRLELSLIKGSYTGSESPPSIYNPSYRYWKETWGAFFESRGSGPDALKLENFTRATSIIVIHEGSTIAGMLLSTVFHGESEAAMEHVCVTPFPESTRQLMQKLPDHRCLTGEYLSVAPGFRKSQLPVSLADTMIGILMKIMTEEDIGLALAATIKTANVAEICQRYGYVEVGSYVKIGVDCVMLFNTESTLRAHPDILTRNFVDALWTRRADLRADQVSSKKLSRAA